MFFINPFIYAAGADYESIATVTVGSGGASEVDFTSIPGTYQHLQIRGIARLTTATFTSGSVLLRVNGDTGSTYAYHWLAGDGSSASAFGTSSTSSGFALTATASGAASNVFTASVIDLLDYASTSKTKTFRSLHGYDNDGVDGRIRVASNLWNSTSAVTSIKLYPSSSQTFAQHSTFALYGIKAP